MTSENRQVCSVFDCWSGTRSRAVAKAMRWLLRSIFKDQIHVFFSEDINKGRVWFEEVHKNLSTARAAILCLTPENVDSPWLHFEAGALSVGLAPQDGSEPAHRRRTIFPYLLDVDPGSLSGGPLASFQATHATREDTMRMVSDMAVELFGEAQEEARTRAGRVSTLWKRFEGQFRAHEPIEIAELLPDFESLFRRKTFEESLADCSGQHWMDRYDAAVDTLRRLQSVEGQVTDVCNRASCDLFADLLTAVDGYAMDLKATLLQEIRFERDVKTGRVIIVPPGAGESCDRRRQSVKRIVSELLDDRRRPLIDESVLFRRSETFEEKKRLIHQLETRLMKKGAKWRAAIKGAGAGSDWDLDRIASYIATEQDKAPFDMAAMLSAVGRELDLVRANPDKSSFMPLHYALRMTLCMREEYAEMESSERTALQRVLEDVASESQLQKSARVAQVVNRIRAEADLPVTTQ